MPIPRFRSRTIWAAGTVAAALVLGSPGAPAQAPPIGSVDEAGWQGVLGARPPVSTAQRYVVVLRAPSLASKVEAAGGHASEADMRRWTTAAISAQEQFLARMAASGARLSREYRYVRVLNGFSGHLDPTSLALLDRDHEVAGVYPVRIAYPALDERSSVVVPSAAPGLDVPGLDGTGVTVALLDTGVDPSHPYLRESILPGIDVIDPGSGGLAQPNPSIPGRPERHGTELAGIVSGSDGPDGLHGVAPGASIIPIRIAGWQPDAEGGYAVYSRTDQLLAGLEAAVDPNADGDAHDAARVALVGVAEPYASFPDGPLARAIAGAAALDTLVVAPAGNDGNAGPSFGDIAGPGGAPDALTVGAADGRPATPTVRLFVRAGLRVLFDGVMPLGGAPAGTVTANVVLVSRVAAGRGIAGLFDDQGMSSVAGYAALLPRGELSEETVEEATSAGALIVLGDGPLPAGAFSLDVPPGVSVVGLPGGLASTVRALMAAGVPVTVAVGWVGWTANGDGGSIATFSSRGLAFEGGFKPELVAPGVAVPTSEPGRGQEGEVRYGTVSGTSAAAAVAAGAAAVVAEGLPRAGALDLAGLLVGSAQGLDVDSAASGSGLLDLREAVQQEVVAEPSTISFGTATPGTSAVERRLVVRNVSTRRVAVAVNTSESPVGVTITAKPSNLRLPAAGSAEIVLHADTSGLADDATAATGVVLLRVGNSPSVRVPWGLAVPSPGVRLLSRVAIHSTGGHVSDATPDVLSLVAGAVQSAPDPQLRPVELLEVELWRGSKLLGLLARRRELLPGHYTFGLTGRGPGGEHLSRGSYVVRVVARPGDGTRTQTVDVDYKVK
jgi:subtilisin family serine protease